MSYKLLVCLENNHKQIKLIVVDKKITYNDLLDKCSKKLNKKIRNILINNENLDITKLENNITLVCSLLERSLLKDAPAEEKIQDVKIEATIKIYSKKSYVSTTAMSELNNVAKLEDVCYAIGMPDLHPGKGNPIGAVVITKEVGYPTIVAEDCGCGMSFVKTGIISNKMTYKKLEKLSKKLYLDNELENDKIDDYINEEISWPTKVLPSKKTLFDKQLGTIGGGNHFCELQEIHKIEDALLAAKYEIDEKYCYLLIHSGSRGLGESLLNEHIELNKKMDKQGSAGFKDKELENYIIKHDEACQFAKRNRALIARKFMSNIEGSEYKCLIDIWHNYLEKKDGYIIHRKGVAPADKGPVIIPGSRGAYSYIVEPTNYNIETGYSLAHGAGRKISRKKATINMKEKYKNHEKLIKTDLDSIVICENKDLIYQEAPEAYKDINLVIEDLLDYGLIKVIAILKPLLTYKTKKTRI